MGVYIAEFRIPDSEWVNSMLSIQSIIKDTPSRRLVNHAPITVHIGMDSDNTLSVALSSSKASYISVIDLVSSMLNISSD